MNEVLFVYKNEINTLQLELISAAVDISKGQDISVRVGAILSKAHIVSNAIDSFLDAHRLSDEEHAKIGHYLDSIKELHLASFDLAQKYCFAIRYQ